MILLGLLFIGCITDLLASSVVYPDQELDKCKLDQGVSDCIEANFCKSTAIVLASGGKPRICGWKSEYEPMVCCTKITAPKIGTITDQKWHHISPRGCGLRYDPPDPKLEESLREQGFQLASPEARSQSKATFSGLADTRIAAVGGKSVQLRWPWMVAIFSGPAPRQLCGGVLIDNRHILSAAHCFAGRSLNPKDYTVMIGEIKLDSANERLQLDALKVHEGYSPRYYYNDIVILRLAFPRINAVPACIPSGDTLKPGEMSTLLGWGDLSFGGPSSPVLQEVPGLPIITHGQCDKQYREVSGQPFPRGITDSFLCAGLEEGGKDACQGDSGGPLLHQDGESKAWSAVGIVSFGFGCAEAGYPGVYTKISAFMPWVEKFIQETDKAPVRAERYENLRRRLAQWSRKSR